MASLLAVLGVFGVLGLVVGVLDLLPDLRTADAGVLGVEGAFLGTVWGERGALSRGFLSSSSSLSERCKILITNG